MSLFDVEQLLHYIGTQPRHLMVLLVACVNLHCVISPDIEPQPPEVNYAPFIDRNFLFPREEIVFFETKDPVELRTTQVADPNKEDQLYFAWFGRTSGLLQASTLRRITDEPDPDTGFYLYEGTSRLIDPCDERFANVDNETIWLYVSDRDWRETGSNGVFEQDGQYKIAHVWVLEFNVFCGIE